MLDLGCRLDDTDKRKADRSRLENGCVLRQKIAGEKARRGYIEVLRFGPAQTTQGGVSHRQKWFPTYIQTSRFCSPDARLNGLLRIRSITQIPQKYYVADII